MRFKLGPRKRLADPDGIPEFGLIAERGEGNLDLVVRGEDSKSQDRPLQRGERGASQRVPEKASESD